jgi:hypothetical protein
LALLFVAEQRRGVEVDIDKAVLFVEKNELDRHML